MKVIGFKERYWGKPSYWANVVTTVRTNIFSSSLLIPNIFFASAIMLDLVGNLTSPPQSELLTFLGLGSCLYGIMNHFNE